MSWLPACPRMKQKLWPHKNNGGIAVKFQSNNEMYMHYCKEILSDRKEHSIAEIYQYIVDAAEGKGILGAPLPVKT